MVNIDFPFDLDGRGRTALTDDADHIRDMIEQFLLNRPDFGSGLLQLVFAPNSPELAAALQQTARADLQRWLGDVIEVVELTVTSRDAALCIELRYVVRRTGEVRAATIEQDVA